MNFCDGRVAKSAIRIQYGTGCADGGFVSLLNVPLVQTGQAHGDFGPAEAHGAFQFHLTAHVEGGGFGVGFQDLGNNTGLDAGSDEDLGTILFSQQFSDDFQTAHAAGGGAAGEHRIDAHITGFPESFQRITGYIDAPMEGQTAATGGIDQSYHLRKRRQRKITENQKAALEEMIESAWKERREELENEDVMEEQLAEQVEEFFVEQL